MKEEWMHWIARVKYWAHDTVVLIGILSIFLSLGGARWFGYYFDFALVPVELTEKIAKR